MLQRLDPSLTYVENLKVDNQNGLAIRIFLDLIHGYNLIHNMHIAEEWFLHCIHAMICFPL